MALAVALAATACSAAQPAGPRERPRVRVRSFTEATPVHHILAVPPFAFAATSAGLDRWDLRNGRALHLGAEHGLPGEQVQALDYDRRGEVWIVTEAGLVRYRVEEDAFHEVQAPPGFLGVDSFEGAAVSATKTGAWIGLQRGLFHVTRNGIWSPTAITAPVTDLYDEPGGDLLWIGTAVGLFVWRAGMTSALGPDRGCDLAGVRFVARGPDGDTVVVVGESGEGEQRIVLAAEDGCHSYRLSPDETWVAAASRPDELLVLTDRRLYAMRRPSGARGRSLVRDGMQLLPVPRTDGSRPEPSPFIMQAMPSQLPAGAQALAAFGNEVLVGTRSLGTARVMSGQSALQWLRRGELVGEASSLSVACTAPDDCYVATGARRAWRFDGERFSPTGGGARRVLAVARDPVGRILGLRQTGDQRSISVEEIEGDEWRPTGIVVDCPGNDPELRFARFSPGGLLWLGLRYRDEAGELRPYGVAVIDVALNTVVHHHASEREGQGQAQGQGQGQVEVESQRQGEGEGEREAAGAGEGEGELEPERERGILAEGGILPLPLDVAGIAFAQDGTVWLATSEGAIEVKNEKVTLFRETLGPGGEIPSRVALSANGLVYVAGRNGVATFDGSAWTFPRELAVAVNDLEIGPGDSLWMATDRGLSVYDGGQVRRFDARRGLVENRVDQLAVDQFGRVWLRGPQSLEIVF